jgi:transcription elongation factor Elf1
MQPNTEETQSPKAIDGLIAFDADGKFTCVECKNTAKIQTNSEDGLIDADLAKITADLIANPEKITFGVCAVCGMEYQFMLKTTEVEKTAENANGQITTLVVKPSDEEK